MARPKKKAVAAPIVDDQPIIKGMEAGADGEEGGDENEEDEKDDDEDEDDEEGGAQAKKSDLGEADLVKALNELDGVAQASANGVSPRQAVLAGKLAKGEALNKSENAELSSLLKSGDDEEEATELRKSHRESFTEDPQVAQGFEVSEFLDAFGSLMSKSLDSLKGDLRKSSSDAATRDGAFARTLGAIGAVVLGQAKELQALKHKLEKSESGNEQTRTVEAAPARGVDNARRSSVGQRVNDGGGALRKGESGKGGKSLSRVAIADTVDELLRKSEVSEEGSFTGVDWLLESARYESTGILSKPAMLEVCQARGIDPASVPGLS